MINRRKTMPLGALLLLLLNFVLPVNAGDIVVSGAGEAQVVPDTLSFSIYVKDKGPLVSKLYASVNQRVEQILT